MTRAVSRESAPMHPWSLGLPMDLRPPEEGLALGRALDFAVERRRESEYWWLRGAIARAGDSDDPSELDMAARGQAPDGWGRP